MTNPNDHANRTDLASATEVLSSRVQVLADAVQTNNDLILSLRGEINKKPDDIELKVVAGIASQERLRHLKYAVATAIASSLLGAGAAFYVSNQQGKERCEINADNIRTLVSIIDRPGLRDRFTAQIEDLRSNRNEC